MELSILQSTGDTRDRTGEIQTLLEIQKYCILGSGRFYTTGIKMPAGTTLMGLGTCTELVLEDAVTEGCAVTLNTGCTVKDLALCGGSDCPEDLGTRHGIALLGTATPENRAGQPTDMFVRGCWICGFTGGGLHFRDTGYNMDASVCVSDCRIHGCGAGIDIRHFSEFHKFTNVLSTRNLYGCINNGGNNSFVNCSFDGNGTGFLIDNREKKSPNNSHGSCVCCTINHSGGNKGVGIAVLGAKNGYVFSDCQLFFSAIEIEDARAVQFNNFNCGRDTKISVKDSTVQFNGCVFVTPPRFSLERADGLKLHGCYTKTGEEITLA